MINVLGEKSNKDLVGIILSISVIFILIFLLFNIFNVSLWDDETFTLKLVRHSVNYIIQSTAKDVHPPLYYLILKSVFKGFSLLNIPFNDVILGKIVSFIPMCLLVAFSIVKLRKDFGWLTAGTFALFIITMPNLMRFGIEIRNYSWALLFVTIGFYYAYKIASNPTKKNWILLTIFTILSAYTHYFALASSGIIYLVLLVYLFNKNKSEIKNWFKSTIVLILSYLPWIFVFVGQLSSASDQTWRKPITLESIQSYIWFITSTNPNELIGTITIISITVLVTYYLLKRKKKMNFLVLGPFIPLGTVLIGIIGSFLLTPLFDMRYMLPSLGCFWLTISFMLSKTYSKKQIFVPLLIIFLVVGAVSIGTLVEDEKLNEQSVMSIYTAISEIQNNDIVIYSNIHAFWTFDEYFLRNTSNYFILEKNDPIRPSPIITMSKIKKALDKDKRVWLLGRDRDIHDFNKTLNKHGLIIEKFYDVIPSKDNQYIDSVWRIVEK